jgi:hypothetical protein
MFKARVISTAFVTAILAIAGTGVANATTSFDGLGEETNQVSELNFLGFDPETAAENGYDIRTDSEGVQYSIPESTPEGSMDGAVYGPGQRDDVVQPYDTVGGNCGTATLTGAGNSFFTAYNITDPWVGGPVKHTWRVAVSSDGGYQVFNLDGYANPFWTAWSTSRTIPFSGPRYVGWVSTGTVRTVTGVVCGAFNPSDVWLR